MSLRRVTLSSLLVLAACGEPPPPPLPLPADLELVDQVVEASCGQCQFDMSGEGCDLAIRVDDRASYVDGTDIDDHGDSHADDGFCNAVRSARVSGRSENGRFVVTSLELLVD